MIVLIPAEKIISKISESTVDNRVTTELFEEAIADIHE